MYKMKLKNIFYCLHMTAGQIISFCIDYHIFKIAGSLQLFSFDSIVCHAFNLGKYLRYWIYNKEEK